MIEYPFSTTDLIKIISEKENIRLINILKTIPLCEKEQIPDKMGVYILTNFIKEEYIGCSCNIRRRMYGHRKKDVKSVNVYLTDNMADTLFLETILITLLRPKLNKFCPSTYKAFKTKYGDCHISILKNMEEYGKSIIELGMVYLINNFTGC
jgi:hypothetical protein